MKKIIALLLALVLALGCLTACGSNPEQPSDNTAAPGGSETVESKGTILFMSMLNAGAGYDACVNYLEKYCGELGYKVTVIYPADGNDPAGNLAAVKNAMTNDVVGLIVQQDGGVSQIMAEYPDLFVVGSCTNMPSVFDEGGENAGILTNDHFLGTMGNGRIDGVDVGRDYAKMIIDGGYKRVGVIIFPPFAFPQFTVADAVLRQEIAAHNATLPADEQIEIVGEAEVLMFQPISDAYFMEESHQNMDCIIAMAAGTSMVYPVMKNAMDAGLINPDMKLITGGYEDDEGILADVGGDGVIQGIYICSFEEIIYSVVMLDNAIQGKLPADFTPQRVDGPIMIIDSKEDLAAFRACSMSESADNAVISWDTVKQHLTRYNPDASYQSLIDTIQSATIDAYLDAAN